MIRSYKKELISSLLRPFERSLDEVMRILKKEIDLKRVVKNINDFEKDLNFKDRSKEESKNYKTVSDENHTSVIKISEPISSNKTYPFQSEELPDRILKAVDGNSMALKGDHKNEYEREKKHLIKEAGRVENNHNPENPERSKVKRYDREGDLLIKNSDLPGNSSDDKNDFYGVKKDIVQKNEVPEFFSAEYKQKNIKTESIRKIQFKERSKGDDKNILPDIKHGEDQKTYKDNLFNGLPLKTSGDLKEENPEVLRSDFAVKEDKIMDRKAVSGEYQVSEDENFKNQEKFLLDLATETMPVKVKEAVKSAAIQKCIPDNNQGHIPLKKSLVRNERKVFDLTDLSGKEKESKSNSIEAGKGSLPAVWDESSTLSFNYGGIKKSENLPGRSSESKENSLLRGELTSLEESLVKILKTSARRQGLDI